jgi:hypothetical protein
MSDKRRSLIAALVLYAVLTGALAILSMGRNDGHLIYAFDDAYIHMAMAKNFAREGVWGVTRHGFTSTSSSPLWTLLLSAVFRLLGVRSILPLILNLLSGGMAIAAAHAFLARRGGPEALVFGGLVMLVLLTPLPSLALTGMEHSLHTGLMLLFVSLGAAALVGGPAGKRSAAGLSLLAALLAATRYEGLFVIAVIAMLFLLRGRWRLALAIGAAAAIPALVYGAFSIGHGWFFFPNSLVLKPSTSDLSTAGGVAEFLGKASGRRLWMSPHYLALFLAALAGVALYARRGREALEREGFWAALAFMGAVLLHLQYVGVGWTFRHEGYLVGLGVIVVTGAVMDHLSSMRGKEAAKHGWVKIGIAVACLLVLLGCFPLAKRAARVIATTPQASINIYQQQYQMGLFLRKYYNGQSVAANDIGAISYLADLELLDLAGLASKEVATLLRDKAMDEAHVKPLTDARKTAIAVVYESWFQGIRDDWVKAGEWKIRDNVICAQDTVSLWAVDPDQTASLKENLQAFAGQLPKAVIQSGPYLSEGGE